MISSPSSTFCEVGSFCSLSAIGGHAIDEPMALGDLLPSFFCCLGCYLQIKVRCDLLTVIEGTNDGG